MPVLILPKRQSPRLSLFPLNHPQPSAGAPVTLDVTLAGPSAVTLDPALPPGSGSGEGDEMEEVEAAPNPGSQGDVTPAAPRPPPSLAHGGFDDRHCEDK
jgi:hypothetical protein